MVNPDGKGPLGRPRRRRENNKIAGGNKAEVINVRTLDWRDFSKL